VSQLVPSAPHATGAMVPVAPSFWMAHVIFFITYLLSNARGVYELKPNKKISDFYYENRKAKALTIMILSIFAAIGISVARYYTNTETVPGILVGFLLVAPVSYGWYKFAETCGARHADVFGIVPQLLPSNAKDETAITCAFAPKP
jgi:hypothetical protein